MENSYITLGGDIGDTVAWHAVQPHFVQLRKLFAKYCVTPYASELNEIALVTRVDGDLASFNFEGCDRLRLAKKQRYITIDIGVPRNRWEKIAPLQFRQYLIECVKQAFTLIVSKLKKEKMQIDEDALFRDYYRVEQEFLKVD